MPIAVGVLYKIYIDLFQLRASNIKITSKFLLRNVERLEEEHIYNWRSSSILGLEAKEKKNYFLFFGSEV
jgi:hypothetical protein